MTALPPTSDDRIVWDAWLAQYRLPVLTVADELGTFAAIADVALSSDALAARLGVDARALKIHLGLLAAMGFVECRGGACRASAAARTWLHPDGEGYYGPAIQGFRTSQPLHAQLMATLKTGDRAEGHVSAAAEWERGEMPPELALHITAYMNAHSGASSRGLPRLPLFGQVAARCRRRFGGIFDPTGQGLAAAARYRDGDRGGLHGGRQIHHPGRDRRASDDTGDQHVHA
jgi:3-hydroxy-5-methyl-1-naphthoate 3-O-methyltransferase